MADLGKIDREFFETHLAPNLGADRSDVALGPTHGVDFGLLNLDGTAVAMATDPVSILPALGFDRAARFAFDIVLADVAVSGLAPSHLAVGFTLPPEMTDAEFATVWNAFDEEATALGASIVTGHTARYAECRYPWVGAATALAVGDPADVVRPDGARPGDILLLTKGPGVETTGLLTTLHPEAFDLPPETLAAAQARLEETRCVRDATTAAAAGAVTAMHDATEGGVYGALSELVESAGVRVDVDRDAVPLRPGVEATCALLGVDPWAVSTAGTLLVAVDADDADDVLAALDARGTPVAAVGRVRSGSGAYVDGERVEHPGTDPGWEAYARLADGSE